MTASLGDTSMRSAECAVTTKNGYGEPASAAHPRCAVAWRPASVLSENGSAPKQVWMRPGTATMMDMMDAVLSDVPWLCPLTSGYG